MEKVVIQSIKDHTSERQHILDSNGVPVLDEKGQPKMASEIRLVPVHTVNRTITCQLADGATLLGAMLWLLLTS